MPKICVSIKRLNPDVEIPQYHTTGAVGFDLAAAEDTGIAPQTVALIPTGLSIKVPDGHVLILAARSSTPTKHDLLTPHGIGIIDQDYCGPGDELKVQVFNFSQHHRYIRKGTRIAQGMFLPVTRAGFEEVNGDLSEVGRGGFGSTDYVIPVG